MAVTKMPPLVSRESYLGVTAEPEYARLIGSSRDVGWSSILIDAFEASGESDDYERRVTPDIRIVTGLMGAYEVTVHQGGRPRKAILHPGAVGITDGQHSLRFRWRNLHRSRPFRVATAYLPTPFFLEALELLRRPGQRLATEVGAPLVFNDGVVGGVLAALVRAMGEPGNDAYAEQAAYWLAMHMAQMRGTSIDPFGDDRGMGAIVDRRLNRVIEFMEANLAGPITIADMAAEAGVSPFHFARLFQRAIGVTPLRFLAERRMRLGERLITTTDMPVALIATATGYASASAFGAAFRRHFGANPSAFRSGD
jgi:AraC family transcriptional regulator